MSFLRNIKLDKAHTGTLLLSLVSTVIAALISEEKKERKVQRSALLRHVLICTNTPKNLTLTHLAFAYVLKERICWAGQGDQRRCRPEAHQYGAGSQRLSYHRSS